MVQSFGFGLETRSVAILDHKEQVVSDEDDSDDILIPATPDPSGVKHRQHRFPGKHKVKLFTDIPDFEAGSSDPDVLEDGLPLDDPPPTP